MNWKIILLLSLIGGIMGLGSVFRFTIGIEPYLWIVIFLFVALITAKNARGYFFTHGLLLGLFLTITNTLVQLAMLDTYLTNNPEIKKSYAESLNGGNPHLIIITMIPVIGIISGVILGIMVMAASKLIVKN